MVHLYVFAYILHQKEIKIFIFISLQFLCKKQQNFSYIILMNLVENFQAESVMVVSLDCMKIYDLYEYCMKIFELVYEGMLRWP